MGWENCHRDSPGYQPFVLLAIVGSSNRRCFTQSCPACSRLNAEYGGTFLLNRAVDEIVMDNGRVKAVRSDGKAREHTHT